MWCGAGRACCVEQFVGLVNWSSRDDIIIRHPCDVSFVEIQDFLREWCPGILAGYGLEDEGIVVRLWSDCGPILY